MAPQKPTTKNEPSSIAIAFDLVCQACAMVPFSKAQHQKIDQALLEIRDALKDWEESKKKKA